MQGNRKAVYQAMQQSAMDFGAVSECDWQMRSDCHFNDLPTTQSIPRTFPCHSCKLLHKAVAPKKTGGQEEANLRIPCSSALPPAIPFAVQLHRWPCNSLLDFPLQPALWRWLPLLRRVSAFILNEAHHNVLRWREGCPEHKQQH